MDARRLNESARRSFPHSWPFPSGDRHLSWARTRSVHHTHRTHRPRRNPNKQSCNNPRSRGCCRN
ncbi:MAG: hypothetical protein F4206_04435 [Gammaproteobacteria bacterium]|nr:hypothetical protein [Gammaproteobacteria bacterium]MYG65965.1 hypothetical protein [Gammaproteobacteria bacterium]